MRATKVRRGRFARSGVVYNAWLQQFVSREGADRVMRRAGFVRGAGNSHWVWPSDGAKAGELKDGRGA